MTQSTATSSTVADDVAAPEPAANSSLRHVLVVGGTLCDWADLSDERWARRVDELGSYCARIGVPWLTLRA